MPLCVPRDPQPRRARRRSPAALRRRWSEERVSSATSRRSRLPRELDSALDGRPRSGDDRDHERGPRRRPGAGRDRARQPDLRAAAPAGAGGSAPPVSAVRGLGRRPTTPNGGRWHGSRTVRRLRGDESGRTAPPPVAGSAEEDKGTQMSARHRRVPGGLRALRVHARRADARCRPGVGQRRRAGRPRPLASRTSDELCGCGQPFSTCPLWTRGRRGRLRRLDRGRAGPAGRTAARRRPTAPPAGPARPVGTAVRRPDRPADGVRPHLPRRRRGDRRRASSSTPPRGRPSGQALAGAPGIDLRMLNVVRDPRAVAWSWKRHVERPHATARHRRDVADPGAPVGRAVERPPAGDGRRSRALGGVRSARLRYEDFVADPVGDPGRARPRRSVSRSPPPTSRPSTRVGSCSGPSHGLSGNPSRFRSGAVELRRDDRWTTEMPSRDRAVVTALTLPLLDGVRLLRRPPRAAAAPDHAADRHERGAPRDRTRT